MSEHTQPAPQQAAAGFPPAGSLGRKVLVGLAVLVAVVLAYLIGRSVLPRWWAQRVGGLVDGRMTVGVPAGLAAGLACTLAPLLVLWAAVRFRRGWRRFLWFVAGAALLALPNLLLLGIVLGSGNAAHAGERILDVEGPGYRGASLVGAVLGGVAFAAILYLAVSRRFSQRRADRLRGQLRERESAGD